MGATISAIVFRPPPPTYIAPSRFFYVDTKCPDSDDPKHDGKGRIPAFFIKRRTAKATFLFSHGNAEDLGMMYPRMKSMSRALNVNIFAYDYCGYGRSTGIASQANCFANIEACYNYLVTDRNISPEQIVLYGRSLGSGVSCYLAAKTASEGRSVGGMILHSPFLSIYRVAVDIGFTIPTDIFPNVKYAPQIKCPSLIIHGKNDDIVPFWHGQALLNAIPPSYRARPLWADNCGHNHIESVYRDLYVEKITKFIHKYVSAKLPPVGIPECDRATVLELGIDDSKSCTNPADCVKLNSTWVKHGRLIIKEAVASKKSTDEQRKSKEQVPQQTVTNPPLKSSLPFTTVHNDGSLLLQWNDFVTSSKIAASMGYTQGDTVLDINAHQPDDCRGDKETSGRGEAVAPERSKTKRSARARSPVLVTKTPYKVKHNRGMVCDELHTVERNPSAKKNAFDMKRVLKSSIIIGRGAPSRKLVRENRSSYT